MSFPFGQCHEPVFDLGETILVLHSAVKLPALRLVWPRHETEFFDGFVRSQLAFRHALIPASCPRAGNQLIESCLLESKQTRYEEPLAFNTHLLARKIDSDFI